jgi:hypothetical protein
MNGALLGHATQASLGLRNLPNYQMRVGVGRCGAIRREAM